MKMPRVVEITYNHFNELDIEKGESGSIETKEDGSTNIKRTWAAGDITSGPNNFRQIVTARPRRAIATDNVLSYLGLSKIR